MNLVVAAFYKFVPIPDGEALQAQLVPLCQQHGIRGTILLAPEGINGTIAGEREGILAVLGWLRTDPRWADLEVKESFADQMPFYRLKVRLKPEIISLGVAAVDPTQQSGLAVPPSQWNGLLADPEVVLIDTRNTYEVNIGTFRGARNPQTDSFREFPAYVQHYLDRRRDRKVAMFCTGGIRCEKASAYLLAQGFDQVYQLHGGILKYLEEVPASQSLWEGECFVFDQRVAVSHGLTLGSYRLCHACGYPVSPAECLSPEYVLGVSCPHCFPTLTPERRSRMAERQKQIQLAQERGLPSPFSSSFPQFLKEPPFGGILSGS